ncbi:MAG TPA: GTP-binding protein, partial [Sulfurospirillum arcachonense]|nr:GTP-binding protein [Sulfurospirillum arcachonense]
MKHIIIGTAGHVDHGKTALIEALTGFAGDTLEEEKKRGITINLSFSNLVNEDTNVAFIDVPGHEKLLKNMISGAFGFDAAMVVIDANEGVMPQT